MLKYAIISMVPLSIIFASNKIESISTPGKYIIYDFLDKRNNAEIEITANNDDAAYSFPDDYFTLVIKLSVKEKITLAKYNFVSSYGMFNVIFADLDGDNIKEIALITGSGRGTSARTKLMTILKYDGTSIGSIFDKKISGYYDAGLAWEYEVKFGIINDMHYIMLILNDTSISDRLKYKNLIPEKDSLIIKFKSKQKEKVLKAEVKKAEVTFQLSKEKVSSIGDVPIICLNTNELHLYSTPL